jgi:hypothetical protein
VRKPLRSSGQPGCPDRTLCRSGRLAFRLDTCGGGPCQSDV